MVIDEIHSFKNLVCIAKHELNQESGSVHVFQSKVGDLIDSIEGSPHVFDPIHIL